MTNSEISDLENYTDQYEEAMKNQKKANSEGAWQAMEELKKSIHEKAAALRNKHLNDDEVVKQDGIVVSISKNRDSGYRSGAQRETNNRSETTSGSSSSSTSTNTVEKNTTTVDEDTEQKSTSDVEGTSEDVNVVHSDGFGHRDDNYYLANVGYESIVNVYTVSTEIDKKFTVKKTGVYIDGEIGVSALDIELKTNTYNITNNLGVSGGTEGEVLTAGAEAAFGLSKDSIGLKGSAMASGATGQISGTVHVFGRSITLTGEGYAGAVGAGAKLIWTKKDGFEMGIRAAELFGLGLNLSIK